MNKPHLQSPTVIQLDFRARLREELRRRRQSRPGFSMRAFARFLKTDPSTLQKIMEGGRALGATSIQKLGTKLGLTESEIKAYQEAHQGRRRLHTSLAHDKQRAGYVVLGAEFASLISEVESFAVLELLKISDFKVSPSSVSKALGISGPAATKILQKMSDAGWIVKGEGGPWKSNLAATTTDPSDPNMNAARRSLMDKILERSRKAYAQNAEKKTLHFAKTLAFDRRQLGAVMVKLRNLADDLEAEAEKLTDLNEVYQLQIGFYPLTTFPEDEA
jgi:uncharacterized protein (TIGR02147 family)